jgi:FkbM family methyltransferase
LRGCLFFSRVFAEKESGMIKKLFLAVTQFFIKLIPIKVQLNIIAVIGFDRIANLYYNILYTRLQSKLLDFLKMEQLIGLTNEQENVLKSAPSREVYKQLLMTYYEKEQDVFNFNGAKFFNLFADKSVSDGFRSIFLETFLVSLFFGAHYGRELLEQLEPVMHDGPYGWQEEGFDVTVHQLDIVIDAGAWIGDFAAYAASKKAEVYAFEPTAETFALLEETVRLNGRITPVQKGLGEQNETLTFYQHSERTLTNSLFKPTNSRHHISTRTISITSLDDFVRENNIPRVDFIKADIEGAERDMLKGARHVLKTFAPRLALCTYHLPDDPEVMARLIMEANPAYRIIQRSKKLYACVPAASASVLSIK